MILISLTLRHSLLQSRQLVCTLGIEEVDDVRRSVKRQLERDIGDN